MEFHVIKEDDLFYLSNVDGDIPQPSENQFGYGLFTKDTRVLSQLTFHVEPNMLLELDADDSGNYQAVYRYTNREYHENDELRIPRECMLVRRRQLVDGHRFYEEGFVHNYSQQPLEFDIRYALAADFRDMFEVRGFARAQHAGEVVVDADENAVSFVHTALDGVKSTTTARLAVVEESGQQVHKSGKHVISGDNPQSGANLSTTVRVEPGAETRWLLTVEAVVANDATRVTEHVQNDLETVFHEAQQHISADYDKWLHNVPRVTGNAAFEQWYTRGISDIRMLLTDIGHGKFPVAGVPWFAVPFGRDSLIAALQLLLANPEVAKGTLATMAAYQGTKVDPSRDEQPGKIMHELRAGELTRTGELPFGPYYGTIDATGLFLNLAADYFAWAQNAEFIREILPNVERAFEWMEQYGDRDADGFVEYYQEASKGIANQGWKDSGDSVVHKDGSLAVAPIALCEVQGYSYRAYAKWGSLYEALGDRGRAQTVRAKAEQLQKRFVQAFWMDDEDSLALALDGQKQKVASVSSNMGQVLWSGILPDDLAHRMIRRILADDLFNGFGIRTLSSKEVAYNPLSYHDGSIWPHDNSVIIAGMQVYGATAAVATAVGGLFKTAQTFPHLRLPELFSGFGTNEVESPLPYPVSCSPQAWAAATPVLSLQALLGIQPDITGTRVFIDPVLPDGVDDLSVTGIRISKGELDLVLKKAASGETTVHVKRNTTGRDVVLARRWGGEA